MVLPRSLVRTSSATTWCAVPETANPRVTIEQSARDFGVDPVTLSKWIRTTEIDEGATLGQSRAEDVELREARQWVRLLEQETRF